MYNERPVLHLFWINTTLYFILSSHHHGPSQNNPSADHGNDLKKRKKKKKKLLLLFLLQLFDPSIETPLNATHRYIAWTHFTLSPFLF